MRNWRFAFLALILSAGAWQQPNLNALDLAQDDEDAKFVFEVSDVLGNEFYDPAILNYPKFYNAALEQIAGELKKQNIEFKSDKINDKTALKDCKDHFAHEFGRAKNLVKGKKEFANHQLAFAAADGFLTAVDDSHTYFLDPEQYQSSEGGVYSGIGALLKKLEDNFYYLGRIYPNSPAEKTGLKRFDRLLEVDGRAIPNDASQIAKQIRGLGDTEVEITVERKGERLKFKIKRGTIMTPVFHGELIKTDDKILAYMQLEGFRIGASGELRRFILKAQKEGAKGFLLDLRGNPGGYLFEVDAVLEIFLKKDTPTYILKDKNSTEKRKTRSDPISESALVVLIDDDSGSGSEVCAALLQENGRATIVGEKSRGSVSVGQSYRLSFGAGMTVTVNQFFTAKGKKLEKEGVHPDIEIKFKKEDIFNARDAQLDRAIKVLKEKISRRLRREILFYNMKYNAIAFIKNRRQLQTIQNCSQRFALPDLYYF